MVEIITDFLGTIFKDLEYRELVYAMLIIECSIACVLSFVSGIIVTGDGYCLGVKYGKTNRLATTVQFICMIIAALLFLNVIIFWISDFVAHLSWGYFFCGLLGIAISFICIIIGFGIGGSKEEKLQKKYIKEIETILFSNPVFKSVIQIINSDSSIKRIHIYRDGIAFYEEQGEIPIIEEEKFSEGAWNYDSASEILEKHKQKWINENGTVLKCGTSKYLKYIDFGLDNSETAMKEFPKYIKLFANNDFSYSYPFKKKWLYWDTIHVPSSMYAAGGKVYSTGSSDKTLAASKKAYLAYVVVMGKKEDNSDNKTVQNVLQKW